MSSRFERRLNEPSSRYAAPKDDREYHEEDDDVGDNTMASQLLRQQQQHHAISSNHSTTSSNADPFGLEQKKPPPPVQQQPQRGQNPDRAPIPRPQQRPASSSSHRYETKDSRGVAISQQAHSIRTARNAPLADYLQHTPVVPSSRRPHQDRQSFPVSLTSPQQSRPSVIGVSPGKPLNISHISPQDSVSLLSSPDEGLPPDAHRVSYHKEERVADVF